MSAVTAAAIVILSACVAGLILSALYALVMFTLKVLADARKRD